MTWNLSISDFGVGEVLFDPGLERRAHVDARVADRLSVAAVRDQKIREFLHRSGVLAVGYIDDLAARHINEQADIIVAAPRRSFIRRDLAHFR